MRTQVSGSKLDCAAIDSCVLHRSYLIIGISSYTLNVLSSKWQRPKTAQSYEKVRRPKRDRRYPMPANLFGFQTPAKAPNPNKSNVHEACDCRYVPLEQ
jgi:hypothetical protein